jgi:hypothetical protein
VRFPAAAPYAVVVALFGCGSPTSVQSADPSARGYAPPGEIAVVVARVDRDARMRQVLVEVRSSPSAPTVDFTGQLEGTWLETQVLRDGEWVTTTNHGHCGTGIEQRTLRPGGLLVEQDDQWIGEGGPVRLGFAYRRPGSDEVLVAWSEPIE